MIDLLILLKAANHNIQVLHRNLIGAEWFPTHEKLGEYYENVQEVFDDLCEVFNGLGIKEPTMEETAKSQIVIK